MDIICQFNKLKVPKFHGGSDPLKYEDWKRKLENLFEIMDYPDQYKVALISSKVMYILTNTHQGYMIKTQVKE